MDEEIKKEIRKIVPNSFEHEGGTRDKIILGKFRWIH